MFISWPIFNLIFIAISHWGFIGGVRKAFLSEVIFRGGISLKEFQKKLNDVNFGENLDRVIAELHFLFFRLLALTNSKLG